MNIQCTQKLLDILKQPCVIPENGNPLMDWHASIMKLQKRNTVIFANDRCRYTVVLHGLKAADFKKLGMHFQTALTDVLLAEGVSQQVIDLYLEMAGPLHFTRTSSRSVIGQIVQTGFELPYFADLLMAGQIGQTDFNLKYGTHLQKVDQDYVYPRDLMLALLDRLVQGDVASRPADDLKPVVPTGEKAYVFRIKLPCGDQSIWRSVVVPARSTFLKLHRIIQICFNWQDAHLHQFQVLDENGHILEESRDVSIEDDDLSDQEEFDRFSERRGLAFFVPEYRSLRYLYDFGDEWMHEIELEKVLENYSGVMPTCLDGDGTAPPEDVGGEYGYEEFSEAIKDDAEPTQRAEYLKWAKSQGWKPFDLAAINKKLKRLQ